MFFELDDGGKPHHYSPYDKAGRTFPGTKKRFMFKEFTKKRFSVTAFPCGSAAFQCTAMFSRQAVGRQTPGSGMRTARSF